MAKKCKVCSSNGKRIETRYNCKLCRISLYKAEFFIRYYTLKHYSSL